MFKVKSHQATFAIYHKMHDVKLAFRKLNKMGFQSKDISYLQTNSRGAQDFTQVQKCQLLNVALIGSSLGFLIAVTIVFLRFETNETQSLFIPSLIILFGTVIGFAAGALVGIGIPAFAANRFGQYLKVGGILFSVENKNSADTKMTLSILNSTGGQDIQVAPETSTWSKALKEDQDPLVFESEKSLRRDL